MSKKKEILKTFLETNPIRLYVASIVVLVGIIYSVFHFIYESKRVIYEEKLQFEYQKKINLLDDERSRIAIRIGNEKSIFDFDDIFVDGSQLPSNYARIDNSPFVVPQFYNDNNWSWKKTDFGQIIDEAQPNYLSSSTEMLEMLKLTKINCFEKNEIFELKIRDNVIFLRPRVIFEFTSREKLKETIEALMKFGKTGKVPFKENEDGTPYLVDTNEYKLREIPNTEVTYFNVFFNTFTAQKDSRLTDYLGEFNISEYYFNKDVFLINGYYDIKKVSNNKLEKWYSLKLGIKRKEGLYIIYFNMPVSGNYQDVKLLNTLIHGLKIIK